MTESLGHNPESKEQPSVADSSKDPLTELPADSILQFGKEDSGYILKVYPSKSVTISYKDENDEWIEELIWPKQQ